MISILALIFLFLSLAQGDMVKLRILGIISSIFFIVEYYTDITLLITNGGIILFHLVRLKRDEITIQHSIDVTLFR